MTFGGVSPVMTYTEVVWWEQGTVGAAERLEPGVGGLGAGAKPRAPLANVGCTERPRGAVREAGLSLGEKAPRPPIFLKARGGSPDAAGPPLPGLYAAGHVPFFGFFLNYSGVLWLFWKQEGRFGSVWVGCGRWGYPRPRRLRRERWRAARGWLRGSPSPSSQAFPPGGDSWGGQIW